MVNPKCNKKVRIKLLIGEIFLVKMYSQAEEKQNKNIIVKSLVIH